METNETLQRYLELFEQARRRVDDANIAAQLVEQVAKDRRVAMMHDRSRDQPFSGQRDAGDIQPATPNQLGLLRRLDVDIPAGLTKQQASALIDEAKMRDAAR